MKAPKFCILLATYNGEQYLDEQVQSIMDQDRVNIKIIASDDMSNDGTKKILDTWCKFDNFKKLENKKLGSASKNFFRLILDADIGSSDYIALSDQDDVWLKDKLIVAFQKIVNKNVAGYSSSFITVWDDNNRKFIDKSNKMKKFDYFFESPGPGNTFVLKREGFLALRDYLIDNIEIIDTVPNHAHDWFIYAFFRYNQLNWYIDSYASLYYRQHENNVFGANYGFRAIKYRFQKVIKFEYFDEVSKILTAIKCENYAFKALGRLSIRDRLFLIFNAGKYRRKKIDVIALAIFFMFVKKTNR